MSVSSIGRPVRGSDGRPQLLLLTEPALPELTDDDLPLLQAFRDAGWDARPAVWSDPIPDADVAIIRSTWDYVGRLDEFLDVLDATARRMQLWNPAETVRWNADKGYLLELSRAGIPMPATTVVRRGSTLDFGAVLGELGADEVVVKPLVGAGGSRTWRGRAGDDVAWAASLANSDVLVQRYVPEVATAGEWSLVFFGDTYSHAVIKHPGAGEFRVQEQYGGSWRAATPQSWMIRAAERVLESIPHSWRYARIDGIVVGGEFLLMEAELIEPQCFFPAAPGSAGMLVGSFR
jgi:glutathione synthase/RimK-type ligase-like ATP-grasp enzyme